MRKRETLLATLGLSPGDRGAVNVPVHRASTLLFPDLATFEAADRGEYPHPTYARYGTPNSEALEKSLAMLQQADHAIVTSSGLSAVVTALMAFLDAGDHLLMVDSVYGPTRRFCDKVLKRMGVEVTYYEPKIGAKIASLIKKNTRVVYMESPGSLTFEMQDIPAICKAARAKKCITIGDLTWATPLYAEPFKLGLDVCVHSITKYVAGHADVMMGAIVCNKNYHPQLLSTYRNMGACPSADNCYLAQRGLRTLAVRVRQQAENALKVAKWLQARPEVEAVLYPALPGDAGYKLWRRDFTGASSLFGFSLKPVPHRALAAMFDGLQLFGMGYSWGGFESLITTFNTEKRKAGAWPYKGQGVRIHIGLEHPDDLIKDLEAGFKRMKKAK